MKKRILFLLLSVLAINSCKKDSSNPSIPINGNIQGNITNTAIGTVINGVSIQTTPPTSAVVTNQTGDYFISEVTPGTYTVTATKLGYNNNSVSVSVSSGKTATANIQLTPSGIAPPAPTLSAPASGSTNLAGSPTLTWNARSGAVNYTLQISTDSLFSSYAYNQSSLTDTSQQINGLSIFTKYYWRVSATNGYGTSDWSSVWNFTTATTMYTPCPGTPTVYYLGKTYNTVQIGSQCWLKENLNVGTMINVIQNPSNNDTIEKYCYNNDTNNCNTYGGLYQWNEAMRYSMTEGTRGICPNNWHIPTQAEFQTLSATVGYDGNALKEIGQGTGTNTSGFSALLSGWRHFFGVFYDLGSDIHFWSSTNNGTYNAYLMYVEYSVLILVTDDDKENGFSVRCVKD